MNKINSVAIIGAGALGVMYGQKLTEALGSGRVFFIADEERANRYKNSGFICNARRCDFRFETGLAGRADLIIVAVKFTALSEALGRIKGFVGDDTIIISLLNGISSERMIAGEFGEERVVYCVAQGMDATKEGVSVIYHNEGRLLIGGAGPEAAGRVGAVAGLLSEAGVPYEIPGDIMYCLWNKLMLNTGVNQVVAVCRGTYADVQREGEPRRMMVEAMREVKEVAGHEGVSLTDGDIESWLKLIDGLNPGGMPSMRQDTKAGRKTEVELFSGTVRALGIKHSVPTPVNDYLYEEIAKIEASY